jgi:Protein of unknown function, DUF547
MAAGIHGPPARSRVMIPWIDALLVVIIAGCSTVPRSFQPVDPIPAERVSHQAWNKIVQAYVHDGQVNYLAIQKDSNFEEYLDQLDRVDPHSLSREYRLAFWINAYNAFAVKGILNGLTPKPYLGWHQYFIGKEYRVGGQRLNLFDLEHEVIRKQLHEPRIHFAIVCASASCPVLQSAAYDGVQLDQQLAQAAKMFINDPTRNRFDRACKIALLSEIFHWYKEDFVVAAGTVQAYVSRYVNDTELARELASVRYRIEYLDYDWSLNGIPPQEGMRAGAP